MSQRGPAIPLPHEYFDPPFLEVDSERAKKIKEFWESVFPDPVDLEKGNDTKHIPEA